MFADKSVLDEQQPAYVGMYNGTLMDDDGCTPGGSDSSRRTAS
jgi:hypothetical protein